MEFAGASRGVGDKSPSVNEPHAMRSEDRTETEGRTPVGIEAKKRPRWRPSLTTSTYATPGIISTTCLVHESTSTTSSPHKKYLMGQAPWTTITSGGRS